jgi:predicted acylesterase/phospholipase RssA
MRIPFVPRHLRASRLQSLSRLARTRRALLAGVGIACISHGLPGEAAAVETAVQGAPVDVASESARPRIGLVLSGGGARGAAHVGVIRMLEQMHIPIDAIAGTSMGAVVGGLYAAGLSGDEIERVFRELDWQEMIRDRAPRRDLAYRRKQDDRNILAKGALGVNASGGVVLPLGLVQGHKITQVLRDATARVADVQDFDQLPTRFRALATDLETGEAVVMGGGDLVTVLRASMSAPGVLTPVERNGRLLVDGGLVDNLPVELARSMGVDRLIVVDVSFPLARRDGLGSAFDITNQMVGIMVRRGTLASKKYLQPGDVLIEPDLGAMTAIEFGRMPQVMEQGRTAALAQAPALAALSLPAADYEQYVAQRARAAEPVVQVAFVRPDAQSQEEAKRVEAVFGDLAGKPLDRPELQQRLASQYRLDDFESVDYRIARDSNGERGLEIDLRRKSWGPTFLRLGVGMENDYEGGATANAAAQLRMTRLNALDAEWIINGQIGEEPKLQTEFYQPLSLRLPYFVAPGFRYQETMKVSGLVVTARATPRCRWPSVRNCRTGAKCASACGAATAAVACWSAIQACPPPRSTSAARSSTSATTGSTAAISRSKARHSAPAGSRIASRLAPLGMRTSCVRRGNWRAVAVATALCGPWMADRPWTTRSYRRRNFSRSADCSICPDSRPTRKSAPSTASRAPSCTAASAGAARDSSSSRPTSGSRWKPATCGRPAMTWTSATSRPAAACSSVPRVRLARSTWPRASRVEANGPFISTSARPSEPSGAEHPERLKCRPSRRVLMAIANEQNLRQSLPVSRPYGLRIRTRRNDPFRHLVGDDWQKEHWFASRAERDAALVQMSGRYVYFRPGDAPTLDFEKVDP